MSHKIVFQVKQAVSSKELSKSTLWGFLLLLLSQVTQYTYANFPVLANLCGETIRKHLGHATSCNWREFSFRRRRSCFFSDLYLRNLAFSHSLQFQYLWRIDLWNASSGNKSLQSLQMR